MGKKQCIVSRLEVFMSDNQRVDTQAQTVEVYSRYYAGKPAHRNDLLMNPEVMFQALAGRRAWIEALRGVCRDMRILDVGGGAGGELALLLELGFPAERLAMVDILPERIEASQQRFQTVDIRCCDAQHLPWSDGAFDVVMEGTMFLQITDDQLARNIATEMVRVTRPGGLLLLADWRYDGGRDGFLAVDRRRVKWLFGIDQGQCSIEKVVKSALVPPLGRFLSARIPSMYFLAQRLFPFAVGHVVYVLRKSK